MRLQDIVNKQSSVESEDVKIPQEALVIWESVSIEINQIWKKYNQLLELGVAREVARCILPVSCMTTVMWQMNLHNLFHFLKLRMAPDAQKEIRDLANAIYELSEPIAPVAFNAFKIVLV